MMWVFLLLSLLGCASVEGYISSLGDFGVGIGNSYVYVSSVNNSYISVTTSSTASHNVVFLTASEFSNSDTSSSHSDYFVASCFSQTSCSTTMSSPMYYNNEDIWIKITNNELSNVLTDVRVFTAPPEYFTCDSKCPYTCAEDCPVTCGTDCPLNCANSCPVTCEEDCPVTCGTDCPINCDSDCGMACEIRC